MIHPHHSLSIVKQCRCLEISRSTVYYTSQVDSDEDRQMMSLIDRIHTDRPFLGVRRITDALRELGYLINPKRVHRLMRKMGIMAIYPKPNLSKRHPPHKVYPY